LSSTRLPVAERPGQPNRLDTIAGPGESLIYSHDANGSVIDDGQKSFAYDASGRLTDVAGLASYSLNGRGQRVRKNANAVTTLFAFDESGRLSGEYGGTGNPIQETVWLGDLPLAVLKPGGIYYIHTDHLDTPRQIHDAIGQAVWVWDVATFGANLANESPSGLGTFTYNPRYAGQYYDSETGLHYNYFRDYDPKTGRYIESDPIGLAGGINTYTYVNGNPISFVDPLGLATLVYQNGTLTVVGNNGEVVGTYPAANNTTNPSGDPNTVGSNGPAPRGTYPVQPPVNTTGRPEYGSAFFPVGAIGLNGQRLDIARQRGIGVHSGRRGHQSRTQGCIRVDESTIQELLRINQNDPITEITIQ
jgi:RHS repeat-associated protein